MLKKINNINELEKIFNEALQTHAQSVAVEMTIPGQNETEFVVNRYRSIKPKLKYYQRMFDNELVHNKIQSIKIVSAGYGDADLWEDR